MNVFIDGVNIIEQTPIKEYLPYVNYIELLGVFSAIIGIIYLAKKSTDGKVDVKAKYFKLFAVLYIGGIILALTTLIKFPWWYKETGYYTYKCTFEDTVPISYIENRFEIIELNDNIWTVRDKIVN